MCLYTEILHSCEYNRWLKINIKRYIVMIVWGSSTLNIKAKNLGASCKACKTGSVSLAAFQKVFTLYWIPVIPLKKVKHVVCQSCTTMYPLETYAEYLNPRETKFKTPLKSFSGLIIIMLIIFTSYFSIINSDKRINEFKANPTIGSYFTFKSSEKDTTSSYAFAKIENITQGKILFYLSKYEYPKEKMAVENAKLAKSHNEDLLRISIYKMDKNELKSMNIETILE